MASSFAFILTSLLILPAAFGQLLNLYPGQGDVLLQGQVLTKDQYLQNGPCRFYLNFDCSLALYDYSQSSSPTWQAYTGNGAYGVNCKLTLKSDGNLVLYQNDNVDDVLWESKTSTPKYSYPLLILKSDCNAAVYGAWFDENVNKL